MFTSRYIVPRAQNLFGGKVATASLLPPSGARNWEWFTGKNYPDLRHGPSTPQRILPTLTKQITYEELHKENTSTIPHNLEIPTLLSATVSAVEFSEVALAEALVVAPAGAVAAERLGRASLLGVLVEEGVGLLIFA